MIINIDRVLSMKTYYLVKKLKKVKVKLIQPKLYKQISQINPQKLLNKLKKEHKLNQKQPLKKVIIQNQDQIKIEEKAI